ncbi:MAG: Unknown protein [uncultured Sulfurovum sp.]|uniref:Lipocalin-like domain-containing protein n=1 Tax=uncultured Sulfurovum sp. TaxID=269237 RepID=A0A6S6UFU3_9BACT|nr:MAG: Unknown protein [uncultured Sulfurovum sp.]
MYNNLKKVNLMKKSVSILLFLFLIFNVAYAKKSHDGETYTMEQLKGTWSFSHKDSTDNSAIEINGTNTYYLNGTLISKGNIKIYNSDKTLSSDTNVIMNDEWTIEGNKLIEQAVECQFEYIKKPKDNVIAMMMEMLLKSMCNDQVKVASTITDISSEKFTTITIGKTEVFTKVKF